MTGSAVRAYILSVGGISIPCPFILLCQARLSGSCHHLQLSKCISSMSPTYVQDEISQCTNAWRESIAKRPLSSKSSALLNEKVVGGQYMKELCTRQRARANTLDLL